MPYIREWLVQAIQDPSQHRDIGKVLAQAAEVYVIRELARRANRHIVPVVGQAFDCTTADNGPIVRTQVKFRMDDWHFETTRRNSKKNADTNGTGHVAYRKDEFDMVTIFRPGPSFGVTGSTIRCIPSAALIDPARPHQLVTRIRMPLRREYDQDVKTDEVIRQMYGTPLPPPG
jgi:uncharacterized linocin/CFP29 family protein